MNVGQGEWLREEQSQCEDVLSVWSLPSVTVASSWGSCLWAALYGLPLSGIVVSVPKAGPGGRGLERRKDLSAGSTGSYLPLVKKLNPWVWISLYFEVAYAWVPRRSLQRPFIVFNEEDLGQMQEVCSMQAGEINIVWSRGEAQLGSAQELPGVQMPWWCWLLRFSW